MMQDQNGKRTLSGTALLPKAAITVFLAFALTFSAGCPDYDYQINISNYDGAKAYNGYTYFQSHVYYPGYFKIDMNGGTHWHRPQGVVVQGAGIGLDLMDDGNVLTALLEHPTIINPDTDEILYTDESIKGHHSVAATSWGTILFLGQYYMTTDYAPWQGCRVLADSIVEIDPDLPSPFNVVWEWKIGDHVDPVAHHWEGMCNGAMIGDWTHNNTVKVIENYRYKGRTYARVILTLSRNLDTFWLIDYPSGDVIWSFGQHGDFGQQAEPVFNTAHEIEFVANDRYGLWDHFLMFDNSEHRVPQVSRALEIRVSPDAATPVHQVVWKWTDPDKWMYNPWGGDANRLPNGNTLITDPYGTIPLQVPYPGARILEVTPSGEVVWEMQIVHPEFPEVIQLTSTFMAQRVPY